jgi:uncharacterized Zn finger protein
MTAKGAVAIVSGESNRGGPSQYPSASGTRRAAGLAARSQRGAGGEPRWSKRFVAVIEGFGHGDRLTRGRAYASGGNVLGFSIRPGEVAASVQGTWEKPYSVTLRIEVYSPEQWARVERELVESAGYIRELLEGRMPERIDRVFTAAGLTLFPVRREFRSDCTCPDKQNPCKHIAAACYVLAQHLDDDPFALFAWRGRDRAVLMRRLEALRDDEAWQQAADEPQDIALAALTADFWRAPAALPEPLAPRPGVPSGAILDRLGPLGRRLRGADLRDLLRPAYTAMRDGKG